MPDETGVQNTDTPTREADASASPQPAGTQQPAATPAATPVAAPVVPESYTFKLPEGLTLDDATLTAVTPLFKGANLTQEQAQAFVDVYGDQIKAQQKHWEDAWAAEKESWSNAAKADKEIGGDNLTASMSSAQAALGKFGTPELKALLQETGYETHPELIRFLARIGKAVGEDSFVAPASAGGGERDFAKILYGNTTPN